MSILTMEYSSPLGTLQIQSNGIAITRIAFIDEFPHHHRSDRHGQICTQTQTLTANESHRQEPIMYDGLQRNNVVDYPLVNSRSLLASADNLTAPLCPVLIAGKRWLDQYFSGIEPSHTLPLVPAGTAFQQRVWQLTQEISWGQSQSYGELARRIAQERGTPMSAQAVGNALSRNPILLMIPCHRVIATNHQLGGYAAGEYRKRALLALEGIRSV
ncbi:methylated-DNA--[protein]-cysteine S-methyltransferase [Trueperella sp. LYQ141]|uniref:methylated-DNA--[protein]-cysteine S-methyltransferase n=1 Tax=Trueperella sp. LYQ141 TaxID=3391058 RepID=UPI0039836DB7